MSEQQDRKEHLQEIKTAGNIIIETWPVQILNLQRELQHHDELKQVLEGLEVADFYQRLGHIAAYCDVVVNGYYTLPDVIKLCETLTDRLVKKRNGVLIVR